MSIRILVPVSWAPPTAGDMKWAGWHLHTRRAALLERSPERREHMCFAPKGDTVFIFHLLLYSHPWKDSLEQRSVGASACRAWRNPRDQWRIVSQKMLCYTRQTWSLIILQSKYVKINRVSEVWSLCTLFLFWRKTVVVCMLHAPVTTVPWKLTCLVLMKGILVNWIFF